MTSEFADLSVGMYEGKDGWNTLITRTETGSALVKKAVEANILETDPFPETNLEHLRQASRNKRRRGEKES
jgi:coenzyme F420 hydrogenase subunit beta